MTNRRIACQVLVFLLAIEPVWCFVLPHPMTLARGRRQQRAPANAFLVRSRVGTFSRLGALYNDLELWTIPEKGGLPDKDFAFDAEQQRKGQQQYWNGRLILDSLRSGNRNPTLSLGPRQENRRPKVEAWAGYLVDSIEESSPLFAFLMNAVETVSTNNIPNKPQLRPRPLARQGDWGAYFDQESTGLVYYFNSRTGKSQWNPPTANFPAVALPIAMQGSWSAYVDHDNTGRVYYFNSRTGQSLWEPPHPNFPKISAPAKTATTRIRSARKPGSWKECRDEENQVFYYNVVTGESQWERPANFSPEDQVTKKSAKQPPPPSKNPLSFVESFTAPLQAEEKKAKARKDVTSDLTTAKPFFVELISPSAEKPLGVVDQEPEKTDLQPHSFFAALVPPVDTSKKNDKQRNSFMEAFMPTPKKKTTSTVEKEPVTPPSWFQSFRISSFLKPRPEAPQGDTKRTNWFTQTFLSSSKSSPHDQVETKEKNSEQIVKEAHEEDRQDLLSYFSLGTRSEHYVEKTAIINQQRQQQATAQQQQPKKPFGMDYTHKFADLMESIFLGPTLRTEPVVKESKPVKEVKAIKETKLVVKESSTVETPPLNYPKGIPHLARWRQNPDRSITGHIRQSDQFPVGMEITTSPAVSVQVRKGTIIKTESGSEYFLV